MKATIVIGFDSEWLVAGGNSVLGTADMAPLRDTEDLPFLPGRTIRGILREAVATMDDCRGLDESAGWARRLFGQRLGAADTEVKMYSEGVLRIGSGVLAAEIANRCRTADEKRDLYSSIRRTALDESRVAKRHTLREMEVCIPGLTLLADVSAPTGRDLEVIGFACCLVRSLGHGRSRGLGRCRMRLVCDGAEVSPTSLPQPPGAMS